MHREFLSCLMLILPFSACVRAVERPNVVLIVVDDLGYGDLACYGSKLNETPHIDALSNGGLRFTDYHTSGPMCTPSRVSILTGRYQQRFGRKFDGPLSGERDRHLGLPHSAVTIAEVLQKQGYATACFGKWHLGFVPPWLPTNQGFDLFRGLAAGDGDHHTHIDRYGNEDWWYNEDLRFERGYTADLLADYSVDFIKQNQSQPFFLYVPHLAIHFPWQGPEDPPHRRKGVDYKTDKWGIIPNKKDVRPHVKAMVESVDESTGRIVAAIANFGLSDRTIVILTSDNGGYLRYGKEFQRISSNGPLRGQKGTLYEGGHRVPFIVSWPGKIAASTSDVVLHSNDLLPTLASIAGVQLSPDAVDGWDLSQLLLSGRRPPKRTLFWRAGSEWAVREGDWKLVYEDGREQLFDLSTDLSEKQNRIEFHPELSDQLRSKWKSWNATMP